ncbi:Calexcitin-2 [Frankliniella fusca]|uniref:Calexcitin-2 n=1 Tax=Frankliniella fusca TaxID=407009 RepID=A0AAE1LIV0_9NEOP|nr:Calexcitin-2 [Frankliniella fusca]
MGVRGLRRDTKSRLWGRENFGQSFWGREPKQFENRWPKCVSCVLADVNRSGTIEKKDFEIAVERICEVRRWPAGTPEADRTKEILMSVWEGLRARADSNQDGQASQNQNSRVFLFVLFVVIIIYPMLGVKTKTFFVGGEGGYNSVSHEEWIAMWDDYAKNAEQPADWHRRYMEFMFDVEDTSGDGSIDVDEFTQVCTCFGATKAECEQAFQRFSQNNSVLVTKDVFAELWKEYFVSEDPGAAGNCIFGKPSIV